MANTEKTDTKKRQLPPFGIYTIEKSVQELREKQIVLFKHSNFLSFGNISRLPKNCLEIDFYQIVLLEKGSITKVNSNITHLEAKQSGILSVHHIRTDNVKKRSVLNFPFLKRDRKHKEVKYEKFINTFELNGENDFSKILQPKEKVLCLLYVDKLAAFLEEEKQKGALINDKHLFPF